MKKLSLFAFATALLFTSLQSFAQGSWVLDKGHARLGFTITHLMVSDVDGSFKNFDATIKTSGADFNNASVTMTGQVASVNTDNTMRDEHLQGPDYFDAAKFPTISFVSTSFLKTEGNNYRVTGNLTMHGVTKSVVLNAVCKTGVNPMSKKNVAGFKITGTVKRADFGIAAKTPSAILGEEVEIVANAEFSQG